MWELQIAGVDFYHIINWFYIYSFLGWLWESAYVSIKEKKLVNRGFIMGPLCTIYGFGAVIVYLVLKPVSGNLCLLYLGGVIVPTILEYVTAVLMERIFHTSWWDYSHDKFNFQGRICLGASLGWGIFSILLFRIFHPFVEMIVGLYSVAAGKILVLVVTLLYAVDFGFSFANAMQIGEKLRNMDRVMDDLYEYVRSTKLYETAEELRERLDRSRLSDYGAELKKRMESRLDAIVAFTSEMPAEDRRERLEEIRGQIEERITSLRALYEQQKAHSNIFSRRTLRAYPHMKSRIQALKDRAQKQRKKD